MDEVIREFLLESHEGLDSLDRDLIELEKRGGDPELLASVFRTVHTIKGTCGFLDFEKLEALSHAGENLLGKIRSGELDLTEPITTTLLRLSDGIRSILRSIEATGTEGNDDFESLVIAFDALADGREIRLEATAPPTDVAAAEAGRGVETSIRVNVSALDILMNLIGELVLTRNQIARHVQGGGGDLVARVQRLDQITTGLQECVMRTRMQPVGNALRNLPKLGRDIARSVGKQVRIEVTGEDTELDRTLVDAIRDPIVHTVRNAIDHGIGDPKSRHNSGKPPVGVVRVSAFHQGGQVHVEITDDGRGLDLERVGEKAVAMGICSRAQVDRMSIAEITELVFEPGFSTAAEISKVSGRGVGMDVVRSNIEAVGGTVALSSEPGRGTQVRIRLPLTLAIINALIVRAGERRFALPQANLVELVSVDRSELETIGAALVLRLRGELLPFTRLSSILGIDSTAETGSVQIAVLEDGGCRFALGVDVIEDTQEVVVKPVSGAIRKAGVYSGATVLGDGDLALILDVPGLLKTWGIGSELQSTGQGPPEPDGDASGERRFLLCRVGECGNVAVPLQLVERIEEFEFQNVERSGRRDVVRYGDGVMPLVNAADNLGYGDAGGDGTGSVRVLVRETAAGRVGIVVQDVLDVVSVDGAPETDVADAQTVIAGDRVADLLGADALDRLIAGELEEVK